MLIKILILLLLLLTFKNTYEPFEQVLTLEKTKIYDIKNWKNIGNNTYVNYITIKAKTGKIGYKNLMSTPQFGFPSLSGGNGYSNINKLQGTDGWKYDYEARHGNKWFWWIVESKNEKEIKIKVIITANSTAPEFPVSYNVKLPDYYHKILTRFWIVFTHNPFVKPIKNSISLPLILDRKNITIEKDMWIKTIRKSVVNIPINAIQGMIDTYNIVGDKFKWISWILSNYESQSQKRIVVQLQLNVSNELDDVKFPFNYNLKIKDGNYNNYINYVIRII